MAELGAVPCQQHRRGLSAEDAPPAQIFIPPLKSSDSTRQLKLGVCISLMTPPASPAAEIHSSCASRGISVPQNGQPGALAKWL